MPKVVCIIPDKGTTNVTSPFRFHKYNNISVIIDCSEIFIETPKDLELQAATWSDYKHHNNIKFLVAVGPNSSINFISEAYTDRISDKQLTVDSGLIELLPKYTTVAMADKGFDLFSECAANSLYLLIPPERRGESQMIHGEVLKTSDIATDRSLLEKFIAERTERSEAAEPICH